jgi:hypothetical protein
MPQQNSCPVQRVQTYLALRSYMSIQASGLTMTNEQQARRMLTAAANPAGGFVFAGEFYEACRSFLARTVASSNSFTGGLKDCSLSYAGPLPVGARAAAGQLPHQRRIPLTSWWLR